ncbi:MAG: histidine phosphatase family protein, partial [Gammaproteobacteria bacterium]|nr:histidine phosphatase family protein [Gammaproteobacteria bacterium]
MTTGSDDPLTEHGWQQLEAVVQSLVVDCVYTSPLQRCRAFAEQYAQAQQLPCLVEPRLIEMGMGSWEDLAKETVLAGSIDLWRLLLRFIDHASVNWVYKLLACQGWHHQIKTLPFA